MKKIVLSLFLLISFYSYSQTYNENMRGNWHLSYVYDNLNGRDVNLSDQNKFYTPDGLENSLFVIGGNANGFGYSGNINATKFFYQYDYVSSTPTKLVLSERLKKTILTLTFIDKNTFLFIKGNYTYYFHLLFRD